MTENYITETLGEDWSGYNGDVLFNKKGEPLIMTVDIESGTRTANWVWNKAKEEWSRVNTISFDNYGDDRFSSKNARNSLSSHSPERQLFHDNKDKASLYSHDKNWKDAASRSDFTSHWQAWRNGDTKDGWKWGENGDGGYAIPVDQEWINKHFGDGDDWGGSLLAEATGWIYYNFKDDPQAAQLFNGGEHFDYYYSYVSMDIDGDGKDEDIPVEVPGDIDKNPSNFQYDWSN